MLEIFKMDLCKEMECGKINKVINISVNGKITKLMAMEYILLIQAIIKVTKIKYRIFL